MQQPVNTAQTFRDLNAELASVFGADGGQLLTPDGLRKELGAAEGADLTQLLLQSPPGSGPWWVCCEAVHSGCCERCAAGTAASRLMACGRNTRPVEWMPVPVLCLLQPLAATGAAARQGAGGADCGPGHEH